MAKKHRQPAPHKSEITALVDSIMEAFSVLDAANEAEDRCKPSNGCGHTMRGSDRATLFHHTSLAALDRIEVLQLGMTTLEPRTLDEALHFIAILNSEWYEYRDRDDDEPETVERERTRRIERMLAALARCLAGLGATSPLLKHYMTASPEAWPALASEAKSEARIVLSAAVQSMVEPSDG